MRKVTAVTAALILAAAGSIGFSSSASAGAYCDATGQCGKVTLLSGSRSVQIVNNWPYQNGTVRTLSSGSSTAHFKDTDGYKVPAGCGAYDAGNQPVAGSGWHKINATNTVVIRVLC